MIKNKFPKSLIIFFSILLVAVLGSIFVNIGMEWFNALNKPTQWIVNIIIPIVWTIIYITFAVILIIWQNKDDLPVTTKVLLIINGVLNVLWCIVFFALKQTFGGNIVIILNLVLGYILVADIYKNKKLYGLILLIYPIWLSIATTLNLAIWILN